MVDILYFREAGGGGGWDSARERRGWCHGSCCFMWRGRGLLPLNVNSSDVIPKLFFSPRCKNFPMQFPASRVQQYSTIIDYIQLSVQKTIVIILVPAIEKVYGWKHVFLIEIKILYLWNNCFPQKSHHWSVVKSLPLRRYLLSRLVHCK